VSSPAHSGRPKLEIGAGIKIAGAGTAEQPLDGTTGGEVESSAITSSGTIPEDW
jgi:hypothetical protein